MLMMVPPRVATALTMSGTEGSCRSRARSKEGAFVTPEVGRQDFSDDECVGAYLSALDRHYGSVWRL
jgi:hypothetical protein